MERSVARRLAATFVAALDVRQVLPEWEPASGLARPKECCSYAMLALVGKTEQAVGLAAGQLLARPSRFDSSLQEWLQQRERRLALAS